MREIEKSLKIDCLFYKYGKIPGRYPNSLVFINDL